jgi:hypothetical protein
VRELDSILNSTGRKLLDHAGTISNREAQEKSKWELLRYKAITLDQVEKDYLNTISSLENRQRRPSRNRSNEPSTHSLRNQKSSIVIHQSINLLFPLSFPMPAKFQKAPKPTVLRDFFGSLDEKRKANLAANTPSNSLIFHI